MTISSEIDRNSYTGNGAVDTYDYTFRIITQNDLLVVVKQTSSGTETTLTISTDYTVTGVGNDGGGTVVLVNASQAWLDGDGDLATGYTITIRRKVTVTQETDIRNQGDFFPETHEDAFDYSRMIDQQQQDEIDRSVKNPEGVLTSVFNPELPEDIATASVALVTNSSGNGWIVGPTTSEISGANASAVAAAASAVLASQWASKTDGIVDSSDYSSKAWSIGGTNVTETASRGAAKEWATKTDNPVDTSEFSSKEYAQGTQASTGGSAKNWATQLGSDVTGASAGDMSSREWAVGTLGRGVSNEGSSKDWASYTGGTVDDTEYSSKEHAQGSQTRGSSGGGSSKDWAQYIGGTVDDTEYSAKKYAQDAATSASAAATAASSSQWSDVQYITNSDSPVSVVDGDAGKLFSVDTSGGAVVFNLPAISGLTLSNPWVVGIKKTTSDSNDITINRNGTDTIAGATSKTISRANAGSNLIPDTDGSPDDWATLDFGEVPIDGDIVGTTDTQDLSNKTITDALTFQEQSSTPSNPSSGDKKFYAKNDGKLYTLNSSGEEVEVGSGAGGAGAKNYVGNSDFEVNSDGVATYDDGAVSGPDDGTGGSPSAITTSLTTTAGEVIRGTQSLKISKSASDGQGEGVAITLDDLDLADQGSEVSLSFDYLINDTDYNADDMKVYLYNVDGDTISDGYSLEYTGSNPRSFSARMPTESGDDTYRLIFHQTSTNASAYDVIVDNLFVGPSAKVVSPIITGWKSYTPTIAGLGTVTGLTAEYLRHGKNIFIKARFTTGTATASTATFSLPSGLSVDSGDVTIQSVFGQMERNGTDQVSCVLADGGDTSLGFGFTTSRLAKAVGTTLGNSQLYSFFTGPIPISEWSAGAVIDEHELSLETIRVSGAGNGGTSITANTTNIDFTEDRDTHNTWNGTQFTAPKSGWYNASGIVNMTASNNISVHAYVDGTFSKSIGFSGTATASQTFRWEGYLEKDEVLSFRTDTSMTLNNSSTDHWIVIKGSHDFTTLGVVQGDPILARLTKSATTATGTGSAVQLTSLTIDIDSHDNISSDTFTAPTPGYYEISGQMDVDTFDGVVSLEYQKNSDANVEITKGSGTSGESLVDGRGGSDIVKLSSGDTLKFYVDGNGVNRDVDAIRIIIKKL